MIKIFNIIIPDKIIYTTLTLAVAYLIYKLVLSLINKSFDLRMKKNKVDNRKQRTMHVIISNIIKYTFGVITLFTILGVLGVNASAIVASIGVVGLAIGLAIQDTLKDILAGIFILVENQFAIGDTIMIGTFKGEVIFLGLKSTKVRSETGEIRIIPNRNIAEITNYSLDSYTEFVDFDLAYDNDEKVVDNIFKQLLSKLPTEIGAIKCDIKYLGIQNIGDKITYRLSVCTDTKYQNEVKCKILIITKELVDKNGVRR
jgi:small conductance mechanosensitive channel